MYSTPSQLLCTIETARPSGENTSSSGMNSGMDEVATLNQQVPSYFQRLPSNEAERKRLLQRIICQHNASCSDPTNKIQSEQLPFSVTNHKLAEWINSTFSDLSADSMYLITFALGCFSTYHDLLTSGPTVPSKANKLVIEDWFQRYGTEVCSKVLTDLSLFINTINHWDNFTLDLRKFCSRVTPESIKKAAFETISGSSSLNRDIINCYYASSATFSQLFVAEDMVCAALSPLRFTLHDIYGLKDRYLHSFRIIMAGIDNFIRSRKTPDSSLVQVLEKGFISWSKLNPSQHVVIDSFKQALGIIEKMQTDEAVRASLQSKEHADSSLMTTPPALPTTHEDEDTFDLC